MESTTRSCFDVAARRNRETLEILENEYNLDYRIEEKVEPRKGVKLLLMFI